MCWQSTACCARRARPVDAALRGATVPGNPISIPPVSIAAAKAALTEQYADPVLRQRATMLWGSRAVGESAIVRQLADHHRLPLVDLRLTPIEPVDIRAPSMPMTWRARRCGSRPTFCPPPTSPPTSCF